MTIHASTLQLLATSQWSEIERSDIEAINRLLVLRTCIHIWGMSKVKSRHLEVITVSVIISAIIAVLVILALVK